ncbi:MAG: proton-conducting transporter membrane subunit [Anaerolineales bacterium]
MTVPLFFLGLPVVASMAAYALRRWVWLQTVIATATALVLALLALQIPLDQVAVIFGRETAFDSSWVVLGRSLTFGPDDRPALAFVFLAAGVFFGGAAAARVSRSFLPVALAMLTLLVATLFVQPFLFAALFLEIIAALAALMLSDERHPRTLGALRLLVFVTLGVPFILLAGWQLEGYSASPDDVALLGRAALLLGIGFFILLSIVPFHSWLASVAEEAPPYAAAYVFTVFQASIVFMMLNSLNQFDWLRANMTFFATLRWGGLAMVVVGGAFAFAQRSMGRLMGYAVLIDFGASIVAVGLGTADGLRAALAIVALRGIGLAVWGLGMGVLVGAPGDDDLDRIRGWARQCPFATAAVVLGGLSIAGFPLTAGFAGRWALYRLLAADNLNLAFVLLLASASVILAYAVALRPMLAQPEAGEDGAPLSEDAPSMVYAGIGVAVVLVLGVFPQWLLPAVTRAAAAFSSLVQ